MQYPKISIVTVSYNQAGFLESTIRSLLDQAYPALEYIIIDGGSTDGSVDIIRKYEKHLAFWISEKDNGMYDGLQKGLSRATGEVMAWINSDDLFHPGSLWVAGEIFSAMPQVEWIQGMASVIDETGRTVMVKNFRKWSKYNFFLGDPEHIQQESTFWRRSLWEKAGARLDTSLRYAGDYELWLRFFDHAQLHSVGTTLGAFRFRTKNQFTLEKMDDYNREANAALAARLGRLSEEEKKTLKKIRRYHERQSPPAFLRKKRLQEYKSLFGFPLPISYDRKNAAFRLGDFAITPPPGNETCL
ncbi:MAG TPA: glycosyltransferase family 2 protein [Bacteroidia bacterium]|nr:glycosyltransferase family 2 protein [Bacteroidia bacterium]